MPTREDLEEEIRAKIRAGLWPGSGSSYVEAFARGLKRETRSEWRWTVIPTPIEDIPDKDLVWNRDQLIEIWKKLNTALQLMDSGIIDRDRQVVIIREDQWGDAKYLIDPTTNIIMRVRLGKFGRQDILDKLAYAAVRIRRDTVESRVRLPTKPPPWWRTVHGERVFEFPLVVRRIVDQSRSMVHDGIRILDEDLSRRTFTLSSKEEILGIMVMEPLPEDYADIKRFGRDLQYTIYAAGYDPCYTSNMRKVIALDMGDRTMEPAKKWAKLLTDHGCEVTTFHGHPPLYHVHAICFYLEKEEDRKRWLEDLRMDAEKRFGPKGPAWVTEPVTSPWLF